jgi:hypothetical protein
MERRRKFAAPEIVQPEAVAWFAFAVSPALLTLTSRNKY